jgi:hypothetical protein
VVKLCRRPKDKRRQKVAVGRHWVGGDYKFVFLGCIHQRIAARYPVRGHTTFSGRLAARGLRRVTVLVPVGCAKGLLRLARELRARQSAGTAGVTLGWRRLSPSAELFVDLQSGARCTIRDTGAPGVGRYLWTVSVFGEHQLPTGRTGELIEARAQAETALAAYMAAKRRR